MVRLIEHPFSSPATTDMERAVQALALELPPEVWDDMRGRWRAVRDDQDAEIGRLRGALDTLVEKCGRPLVYANGTGWLGGHWFTEDEWSKLVEVLPRLKEGDNG